MVCLAEKQKSLSLKVGMTCVSRTVQGIRVLEVRNMGIQVKQIVFSAVEHWGSPYVG